MNAFLQQLSEFGYQGVDFDVVTGRRLQRLDALDKSSADGQSVWRRQG